MPATRVTIALNAKQSQRAPLLLPSNGPIDPEAAKSLQKLIFKTAQSKLRLKRPSRVFVSRTGQELITESDWKNNIKDDVVLLISTGEEYVGLRKEAIVDANPTCSIELLAAKAAVDTLSISQLRITAQTLPGIVHAVGQPDLHPGNKFPIGAVFASRKWIHPPLIGSDIGCGMAWYKTRLSRSQVDGEKGKRVAEKLRGLEGAWRTQADRESWLQDTQGSFSAGEQFDASLGTIGAGNHFAEIQVIEETTAEGEELGLVQDSVILLVHSGSRGYGGSILKKYTTDTHTSFKDDSDEATEYMKEHDTACRWAKANRDLIALRFLSCLEPGNDAWAYGNSSSKESVLSAADVERIKKELTDRNIVDIWHNNVERALWPPAPPSTSDGSSNTEAEYVYIHRKGAAPTYNPASGRPLDLLPLPGSRGTPTLIISPTFSEHTGWGHKNALSLAHGAGRAMSRAKALSSFSQKYSSQALLTPRAGEGTWVICDEKDLVFEEAPEAYKDVQAVCDDLVDAGVAKILGMCRARVSYKVRNESR